LRLLRLAAALVILAQCLAAHAQGNEVMVYEQPIHTRHFSGTIVDPRGMTVEYATVELRSPKDHHLLASTFADGHGFFSFDDRKYGKRVVLRVIQKNFDMVQYTAILRPFGEEHLRLKITIAN
jgi:hypothetical protein